MNYDHCDIEKRISNFWEEDRTNRTLPINLSQPKKYILDMFPYLSGVGLHVGHPRGYVGSDILARFYRMQGYNVLHPMGWDSFGLPGENYAKKNKILPEITTKKNIITFRKQLDSLGLSFDWSREVATSDPKFFKWTQWIFLQLFKEGIAFEDYTMVNWCPALGTILANEEVNNGTSDIGSHPVYRKPLKQWSLRITKYADRLEEDLEEIDWPEKIKSMQKNWIGKSSGHEVRFDIVDSDKYIETYTTRIDTIPSNTYLILAPEHNLVESITTKEQLEGVTKYLHQTSLKSDLARQENQDFTGVFTGSYAINPHNGKKLPIWIADFVLVQYAKGAVFGDAHDKRDFNFAKKYNIPLDTNIYPEKASMDTIQDIKDLKVCYEDDGCNEEKITSLELRSKYSQELIAKGYAKAKINYRLKDWGFSRQRYWGEPIPLVYEIDKDKKITSQAKALDISQLPLLLPVIDNFDLIDYDTSKEDPEPILNRFEDWLYVKGYYTDKEEVIVLKEGQELPEGKALVNFVREGNTMPQWAGSSWYYLRFMDPNNDTGLFDPKIYEYWQEVDIYVGGAEHAVLHLLYARFWHKFLFDIGVTKTKEPFKSLMNQGLIMADDGTKMSKSVGNAISPDEIIEIYGADTLRCFEMFIGPFDQIVSWDSKAIVGIRRFLDRFYSLQTKLVTTDNPELEYITHYTIKEVTENITDYKFNTAIARLMEWSNIANKVDKIGKDQYLDMVKVLSVFAPFVTEEIYQNLTKNSKSITRTIFPIYNQDKLVMSEFTIAVQINGKVRGTIIVNDSTTEEQAIIMAKEVEAINKYLDNMTLLKVIYVKCKILNVVV